jgi:hypothetical protein
MNNIFINASRLWALIACTVSLVWLFACSEEQRGQFPIDSTPPQQVSNPKVTNFPGGATITYQLPDETDLLYVKAIHSFPNGSTQEVITSAFSNSVTIKGYGKSTSVKVKLVSVDMSMNESAPVEVDIHPEDSPIYAILESLEIEEGYGGFSLQWVNPLKEDIVMSVMQQNASGTYEHIETIYSSSQNVLQSVTGLESVKAKFAIYISDYYDNSTDMVTKEMTPWYEVVLDVSKFIPIPQSIKFTVTPWGVGNLNVLWNGVIKSNASAEIVMFNPGAYQPYIAVDLGQKVKLTRFRIWDRYDYFFDLYGSKRIQIFGTNDPVVAKNPESEDSEWILLHPDNPFVSTRPSGQTYLPVREGEEDYEYAIAGQEFKIPREAPNIRYIRYKDLENWGGSTGFSLVELKLWGDPTVEQ